MKVFWRTLFVNCNGEQCKINIAGAVFRGLESAHLSAARVAGAFTLQLLFIWNKFPR